jgi:hypothetical protein
MADSLLQALYYKSDSSTCEELEKELESADKITIRRTSDSLLNLPNEFGSVSEYSELPNISSILYSLPRPPARVPACSE